MDYGLNDLLQKEVEPIVSGMGFSLVELRHNRSKNQNHLSITVYRPEGVSIEDCAAISKNLSPRLELIEGLENLRFEVSSPGLGRVLKAAQEYEIFKGRGVRIMLHGETQWRYGLIEGLKGESVVLSTYGAIEEIRLPDIRKAKLDDSLGG
jgi:ribosome maturation factor RimP